ncbi:hypothetical protein ACQP1P_31745 [Dactylosporangium sp. CA-052675]|uniref:hypothetical protein n=1 Tax=Dactylosporangium sp. CA-052675 TaxID=3239927 RepID=UPI003D8A7525
MSGFGFESTAAEVLAGVDLAGRRAVVTGGASGIGIETARALAGAGAAVTLAVRGTAAGEATAPGGIRTNLQRHIDVDELVRTATAANGGVPIRWKTPEQGAATSALLAASPAADGVGGRYYEDCREAEPNRPGTRTGVAAYALDPGAAARLWDASAAATHITW